MKSGITAAQAIAKRSEFTTQIVVFEGDTEGGHRKVNFDAQEQPVWTAGECLVNNLCNDTICDRLFSN